MSGNITPMAQKEFINKNADVDWSRIAPKYLEHIFSPFAKEMTNEVGGKKSRNLLLNKLREIPLEESSRMRVADYGCGPGNLLPYIENKFLNVTGVEKNKEGLDIAKKHAESLSVVFNAVNADFSKYTPTEPYDIIIAVNSILPSNRKDVLPMLESVRRGLNNNGRFLAIMPSYNACERLVEYYQKYSPGKETDELLKRRKMDKKDLSIDEDGWRQCYHTPESMKQEFQKAGLRIIEEPQKIYYPWELSKKFDFGNFPMEEEIWDWFVMAKIDKHEKTQHQIQLPLSKEAL